MTKEEKEAIKYLEQIKQDFLNSAKQRRENGEDTGYGTLEDVDKLSAFEIGIILKLIQNQQTELEKKKEDIQRMQELLDLSDANNVKKDKAINEMAKLIQEVATSTPGTTFYYLRKQGFDDSKCKNCITQKGCGECIKQYCKKKAEDN